eukprot:scaffold2752_cov393-Prasinococcus_capsulatus_cf.AAC.24
MQHHVAYHDGTVTCANEGEPYFAFELNSGQRVQYPLAGFASTAKPGNCSLAVSPRLRVYRFGSVTRLSFGAWTSLLPSSAQHGAKLALSLPENLALLSVWMTPITTIIAAIVKRNPLTKWKRAAQRANTETLCAHDTCRAVSRRNAKMAPATRDSTNTNMSLPTATASEYMQ